MRRIFIILTGLCAMINSYAYTTRLSLEGETVKLSLSTVTGSIQWMESGDLITWSEITNATTNILEVAPTANKYYVAQVRLNDCLWNSDTTRVYVYNNATTLQQLVNDELPLNAIAQAGFDITPLYDQGYSLEELVQAGADVLKLYQKGVYVGSLKNAGASEASLQAAGLTGVVTDVDGNEYPWVQIDNLRWTTKNLRTLNVRLPDSEKSECDLGKCNMIVFNRTEFAYGWSSMLDVDTVTERLTDDQLVLYSGICATYACPDGWRLPTDDEFMYLDSIVKLDTVIVLVNGYIPQVANYYYNGNIIGNAVDYMPILTNTAIPYIDGGSLGLNLSFDDGAYVGNDNRELIGEIIGGGYWTSTDYGNHDKWVRAVKKNIMSYHRYQEYEGQGYSVRCVQETGE